MKLEELWWNCGAPLLEPCWGLGGTLHGTFWRPKTDLTLENPPFSTGNTTSFLVDDVPLSS